MMFGGRVAEELIFGRSTDHRRLGTTSRQATNLARRMVTEFGMSDKLGPPLRYSGERAGGLPRPLGHAAQEHVGRDGALIDEEVRRIVEEARRPRRARS
jgi:cell division protease FtsH